MTPKSIQQIWKEGNFFSVLLPLGALSAIKTKIFPFKNKALGVMSCKMAQQEVRLIHPPQSNHGGGRSDWNQPFGNSGAQWDAYNQGAARHREAADLSQVSTVDEPASLPHSSAITAVGRATQSPRAEGYPGGRAGSVCVCVGGWPFLLKIWGWVFWLESLCLCHCCRHKIYNRIETPMLFPRKPKCSATWDLLIHLFVCSTKTGSCYVLGTGETVINKTDKIPNLHCDRWSQTGTVVVHWSVGWGQRQE